MEDQASGGCHYESPSPNLVCRGWDPFLGRIPGTSGIGRNDADPGGYDVDGSRWFSWRSSPFFGNDGDAWDLCCQYGCALLGFGDRRRFQVR